jgi:homopolymeric O-antigen transport system ATP-binding protein
MSDTVIKADNIGKKYRVAHKKHAPYTALRDVVAEKAKALGQRIFSTFNTLSRDSSSEDFWALKNISFDVKQGECIGIIGHNGAGKSTLLKILSRITEPTTGRIQINGLVGSLLEVGTGFHPELTGRENIFLNGAILGMSKSEIKIKFDEIVAFAEVEKFLDTPVKRYSSGMYVRLAFAVAAHLETEILLVDEVLAVGDIEFQKKCLGKMQDVGKKEGRTILFISHQMAAIQSLCHNVIWLDHGKIIKNGLALDVVRSYEGNQLKKLDNYSYIAERPPDDVQHSGFYVNRVEMFNSKNENTIFFSYNELLLLDVELSGRFRSDNFSLEFRIYKNLKEFSCVGSSGLLHGLYFDANAKKIRIKIGPLILTNGSYSISMRLVEGSSILDNWDHACLFNIIECNPFPMPREITAPVCVVQHSYSVIKN